MATVIEITTSAQRRNTTIGPDANKPFFDAVLAGQGQILYQTNKEVFTAANGYQADPPVSLLVQVIGLCHEWRIPLTLAPDVLWYVIVSEALTYAREFSRRPDVLLGVPLMATQQLRLRDDHLPYTQGPAGWITVGETISATQQMYVGDTLSGLVKADFSTTSPVDQIAITTTFGGQVALPASETATGELDRMAPANSGIPRIRLLGAVHDWTRLYGRVRTLSVYCPGLEDYFQAVLDVLTEVQQGFAGKPNTSFWRALYKRRPDSVRVDGWITAFFAHRLTSQGPVVREHFNWRRNAGLPLGAFPPHISALPFIGEYGDTAEAYRLIGGITRVYRDAWQYLRPGLGMVITTKGLLGSIP